MSQTSPDRHLLIRSTDPSTVSSAGNSGCAAFHFVITSVTAFLATPAEKMFPPDLRGERDEFADLYAQLTEDNKYIVQNAVKSMMLGMLTTQKTKKNGLS